MSFLYCRTKKQGRELDWAALKIVRLVKIPLAIGKAVRGLLVCLDFYFWEVRFFWWNRSKPAKFKDQWPANEISSEKSALKVFADKSLQSLLSKLSRRSPNLESKKKKNLYERTPHEHCRLFHHPKFGLQSWLLFKAYSAKSVAIQWEREF